jgi:biotin carboxyl carrier protein
MAQKYLVGIDDDEVTYELERNEDGVRVRREGSDTWVCAELDPIGGSDLYLLLINNRPTELYLDRRSGGAIVTLGRHTFDVGVRPWRAGAQRRKRAGTGNAGLVQVKASMTGTIIEIRHDSGSTVAAGDVLLVVEAMKMNNELKAPTGGTVQSILVKSGDRVKAGQPLLSIQTSTEAGSGDNSSG